MADVANVGQHVKFTSRSKKLATNSTESQSHVDAEKASAENMRGENSELEASQSNASRTGAMTSYRAFDDMLEKFTQGYYYKNSPVLYFHIKLDDLDLILSIADKSIQTRKDVEAIAKATYDKGIAHECAARNMAIVCNKLWKLERCGYSFRSHVLHLIELDLLRLKLDDDACCNDQLLAFTNLLCHIYENVKDRNGYKIYMLVEDIMYLLKRMIRETNAETANSSLEHAIIHLYNIGRDLQVVQCEKMARLMDLIRRLLDKKPSISELRLQQLREIFEMYKNGWQEPTDGVRWIFKVLDSCKS